MPGSEGILKFTLQWEPSPAVRSPQVRQLCFWRNVLFRFRLIGATADGIGYGNVSVRCGEGAHFFITGTGTGTIPVLTEEHCCEVLQADIEGNFLRCRGPVRASSESLTHAALYLCSPAIGAVVHAHHRILWERLRGVLPTTSEEFAYGTSELARELMHLYHSRGLGTAGLIVMGGHEEGLLSFGRTLREAASLLLRTLRRYAADTPR